MANCNCTHKNSSSQITLAVNGTISTSFFGVQRCNSTGTCGGYHCNGGSYHNGHLPTSKLVCDNHAVVFAVYGYPYSSNQSPLKKNNDKDTNTQQEQQEIQCRFEWYPLVTSNYYRINIKQNKKSKNYTVQSSSECKQFVDINVLPDIPASIIVFGFDFDPNITPNHKPIDKYTTTFTITSSDPYTYVYENKSTTRRKDKEINGSVVFEASVIEGVCSHS